MGLTQEVLVQSVVTVTVIGAAKRAGWISVHTGRISNESARKAVEAAMWVGDNIVEQAARAFGGVRRLLKR